MRGDDLNFAEHADGSPICSCCRGRKSIGRCGSLHGSGSRKAVGAEFRTPCVEKITTIKLMSLERRSVAQDEGINVLFCEVRSERVCRFLRRCATSKAENNGEYYEYAVHVESNEKCVF